MTEDLIRQRISELQLQEKKLWADLNAVLGAIEDSYYWLNQLKLKRKKRKY